MNTETWKYMENIQKKITCLRIGGSQGPISSFDLQAGHCKACIFAIKGDHWLSEMKAKCTCPVHIPCGYTVRYEKAEKVKFLKKVIK